MQDKWKTEAGIDVYDGWTFQASSMSDIARSVTDTSCSFHLSELARSVYTLYLTIVTDRTSISSPSRCMVRGLCAKLNAADRSLDMDHHIGDLYPSIVGKHNSIL